MNPRAAYIHIPFCARRCGYCDFTVAADRADLVESYLEALAIELSWLEHPREVDSLYLGGGTPTQLNADQLARLLDLVTRWFPPTRGAEITIEANPADLTNHDASGTRSPSTNRDILQLARHAGVNRISLGVQSFHEQTLAVLGRDHRADQARSAVHLCRRYFPSVSLDLIFAVPGQSLDSWQRDLDETLALEPDHISTYGLTYERGTSFWTRRHKGQLIPIAEHEERVLYETAIDRLTAAGFQHYEVSNFARPGHRCRHNLVYWAGEEYYAAGPGAARYVAGRRQQNHRSTTTWIRRILAGQSPVAEEECLEPEDRARERLVLGLRMRKGVRADAFQRATGMSIGELLGPLIQQFVDLGLMEYVQGTLRLTREGLMVSDALWPKILAPRSTPTGPEASRAVTTRATLDRR